MIFSNTQSLEVLVNISSNMFEYKKEKKRRREKIMTISDVFLGKYLKILMIL